MWCLVVFQHDQYLFQDKEKLLLKEEVVDIRLPLLYSDRIEGNKYYGAIGKRMNFNCPVVETSESIEPNDINLELNATGYTSS